MSRVQKQGHKHFTVLASTVSVFRLFGTFEVTAGSQWTYTEINELNEINGRRDVAE